MILNITKENFNEIINSNKKVILDFYADWCNPCKALGPIMEEVSKNYPDIIFGKVNVDDDPGLATMFGVESIPFVVKIENGKYADSFIGLHNSNFVEEFVSK